MKILNCIFGKKKGSTERFFHDYCWALADVGCEVISLTFEGDSVIENLPTNVEVHTLKNFGKWDPIAAWKLKTYLNKVQPDAIIAHGQRAYSMFSNVNREVPLITVCHNAAIKHLEDCHYIIAASESLKALLLKNDIDMENIYTVPNMLYVPQTIAYRNLNWNKNIFNIGVMARFNAKNGLKSFIRAMGILRSRNIKFRVIIAGTGAEGEELKKLAAEVLVDDIISFEGWIVNKDNFFKSIDIFCLPNLQGYSSIAMLEGFKYSMPVVVTDVDGFKDVAKPNDNCLVYSAGEPDSLAEALEQLIKDSVLAKRISKGGFDTLVTEYDNRTIGKKLYKTLEQIIGERMYI